MHFICRHAFDRMDRRIVRKSTENPRLSAPEIRHEVGAGWISNRTVQRRLVEADLYGRRPARKPFLSKANIKARLKFAKDNLNKTVEDWKKILWTDESPFSLVNNNGNRYVRRPSGKRFDPRFTKGTVKFGGRKIMVYGCFSWAGIGPIYRISGIMDQFQYIEILEKVMLPHAQQNMLPNWQLVQDNDPKHTAKRVKKWFTDNHINLLAWPAKSPDLNVIENLWFQVKKRLAGKKFKTPELLFDGVKAAWESIPKQVLETLVESMPRRCKAVIDARGYSTKY